MTKEMIDMADALVQVNNGVPFDMILPKSGCKAERAARVLQELNSAAMENGTSEMTLEEINAEIEAVRGAK